MRVPVILMELSFIRLRRALLKVLIFQLKSNFLMRVPVIVMELRLFVLDEHF